MTEEPFGRQIAPATVRLERLLPGPIDKVWAFLTDPEKRATWFAGGPIELKAGGRVTLVFHHSNLMTPGETFPEKYREVCEDGVSMASTVTRIEAPTLLAYDWPEGDGSRSEVAFELTAVGDKVRLVITHSKLCSREVMVQVASGWHLHTGLLADLMAGRPRRPFWPSFAGLEAEYDKRLPE